MKRLRSVFAPPFHFVAAVELVRQIALGNRLRQLDPVLAIQVDHLGLGAGLAGLTAHVLEALQSGLPLEQVLAVIEQLDDAVAGQIDVDFDGVGFHGRVASRSIQCL